MPPNGNTLCRIVVQNLSNRLMNCSFIDKTIFGRSEFTGGPGVSSSLSLAYSGSQYSYAGNKIVLYGYIKFILGFS